MLMILLSILSVIRHLICGNNLNWLLNLNLIYEALWTPAKCGLLISMLQKLNSFHLTNLITLVLLMWKLMENHLLRYLEDLPSRTTWKPSITEKRGNKAKYLTWHSISPKFEKKTNMPNPIKSLEYIKWYNSSSHRPVKSPSNSIRYNCNKICSWLRRPKTILEIRKKTHFSRWSTILLFTSFSKTLLTTERRLTEKEAQKEDQHS